MSVEKLWLFVNGPINRIFGLGGLITILLYSINTYFTLPPQKGFIPSESPGANDQFNSRLKSIKVLCGVNSLICIGALFMYYIAQNYINDNSGVITIELTGEVLIILMFISAIISFIISIVIRNKVARLK
jgi:hypothetical protein